MIKKLFLVSLLVVALAVPAYAIDFPTTMEAGEYTITVMEENGPWTCFDDPAYTKTLLNIANLKLGIEERSEICTIKLDLQVQQFQIEREATEKIHDLDLMIKDEDLKTKDREIRDLKKNQRINLLGIPEPLWFFILGVVAMGFAAN